MATHLDLEEQEQLDALKHFWNRWGNLITWVLIVALGSYAAWSGWQYWQRRQASQAAVLYEQVESAAQAADVPRLQQTLADMQSRYGGTVYAAYAGLLAGKVLTENGKPAEGKAALQQVSDKAPDDGLRAVARLRLASVQMGEKAYDEALKTLSGSFPAAYAALVADRRGDALLLQDKRVEAGVEFGKAYQGLPEAENYRQLVGVKLNALGIDPRVGVKSGGAS